MTSEWLWVDAGTLKWGDNVWELQADGQFKCVAGQPYEWSVAIDYTKMESDEVV